MEVRRLLNLHGRAVIDEPGNLNECHGGIMRRHMRFPDLAEQRTAGTIGVDVGDVDGHAGDVSSLPARGTHDVDDLLERSGELRGKVTRLDMPMFVSRRLSGNKDQPLTGRSDDTMRKTAWASQMGRVNDLHGPQAPP
jgi:hypothetical protein